MSFRKALEKLEALEDKRLGHGRYYDAETGCFCAVGALAPEVARALSPGKQNDGVGDLWLEIGEVLTAVGISWQEAIEIQYHNDMWRCSPEERYQNVLTLLGAWADEEERRGV